MGKCIFFLCPDITRHVFLILGTVGLPNQKKEKKFAVVEKGG